MTAFDLSATLATYRARIERATAAEAAIATTDDERIAAACAAEWIDLDVAANRLVIEQAVRYATSPGVAIAAVRVLSRLLVAALMNTRHPEALVTFTQEMAAAMKEVGEAIDRGELFAETDGLEDLQRTFRESRQ